MDSASSDRIGKVISPTWLTQIPSAMVGETSTRTGCPAAIEAGSGAAASA